MPVVFCRQSESCVFSLGIPVMSPRWELSNERIDGFGWDLPTVLNKDGLRRGFHSEYWSICGGSWQGWQHAPKAKFPLPITGQNSIYTCGECGLSLPQVALTVFTPCLIILTFPRGLCLLPPSVMVWWLELVKGVFLGSWVWSGGRRNPLPEMCKLEELSGLSHLTWIIQQASWREILWTPWGKQALVCRGKENTDWPFEQVDVWIQHLLKEINTPIWGIFEGSIIG